MLLIYFRHTIFKFPATQVCFKCVKTVPHLTMNYPPSPPSYQNMPSVNYLSRRSEYQVIINNKTCNYNEYDLYYSFIKSYIAISIRAIKLCMTAIMGALTRKVQRWLQLVIPPPLGCGHT